MQVLDFGAARDGVPESKRGQRLVVDTEGMEIDPDTAAMEIDGAADEQETI
jgi:F-box and WD-40 domain protein CDC4